MNNLQNMCSLLETSGMLLIFPIVTLILGFLLKIKPLQAIKSGIMMVVGFIGIKMMVLFLCDAMTPVIEYLSERNGYTAVDVGWQAFALSSWVLPFALISVIVGFLLNVVLIKKHMVRALNTDIWDYCHILFCGAIAYVIFHSYFLSIGICLLGLIITVKCGDFLSDSWQEHTESPGTTGTVIYHLTTMYPVYWLCNQVIDKMPVLKNVDFSADKLTLKLRPFSDPAVLGLATGCGLGIIARLSFGEVIYLGFVIALFLILSGRITSLFMEGLSPISVAAKKWAIDYIGKDNTVLIGMDFSLGQGDLTAINASILLIPIAIVLALILPGISFFPTSLLPNLIVYTCVGSLACRGNLFRVILGSVVLIIFMLYAQTWLMPLTTQLLQTAGMGITVQATGGSSSNIIALIIAFIGKVMGKW